MIRESIEAMTQYKESMQDLLNKYNIEDSVFAYVNGQVYEVTKGYFEVISEHDSLTGAINNSNLNTGIRVINNQKFEVGRICQALRECQETSRILDINTLKNVR
jgi:hypothetical protein